MSAKPRVNRSASLPWVAPQLATLASAAPEGADWVHEIKYDGYRLLAYITATGVRLLSRNEKDWTARFAGMASALSRLRPVPLVVDGEAAVELESGVTSFQALQNAERGAYGGQLQFFAFDLLWVGGEDIRSVPLVERKSRLRAVLAAASAPGIRYSDHVQGQGRAFFEHACVAGLEGIISKRAAGPYRSGRGTDWLKVKCVEEAEFVIGGFTDPMGSREGLGALQVGAYDAAGRLIYQGKVGTGFTEATLRDLRRRLGALERPTSPFTAGPRGAAARTTHWVEPKLVAQIRFTERTEDGRLRHPAFQGLREDKDAAEVKLEEAHESPRREEPGPASRSSVDRARGSARTQARPRRGAGRPQARQRRGSRKEEAPVQVGAVRLTSPSRVVYPADRITKLELARYYERVGERMLPYIAGRPLTVIRCPDDINDCFFQKHVDENPVYDLLDRVAVREEKGVRYYPAVRTVDGLVSLVQLGVVEFHTLGARRDMLEKPDRFTLDLDPDPTLPWARVVRAARAVRALLAELGLTSFVKTTGGKGLHVVVPLQRRSGWEEVKEFSRRIASLLREAAPDDYTLRVSKTRRTGRILIDYLRNARGSVAVEAYSARARPGAPVSLPIRWDALTRSTPGRHTIRTVPKWINAKQSDPWEGYFDVKQSITAPMKRQVGM